MLQSVWTFHFPLFSLFTNMHVASDRRIINSQPHYMFKKRVPIVLSAGGWLACASEQVGGRGCRACMPARNRWAALILRRQIGLALQAAVSENVHNRTLQASQIKRKLEPGRTPEPRRSLRGLELKSNDREKKRDRPHHDGNDRGPAREHE